jgi:hypothetical protein
MCSLLGRRNGRRDKRAAPINLMAELPLGYGQLAIAFRDRLLQSCYLGTRLAHNGLKPGCLLTS